MHHDCLIVGSGHAGVCAAIALRQQGFCGSIGLLGEEVHTPYERPPLSKEYLSGDKPFERILLRPTDFYVSRGIDLRLGHRVAAVDPERKCVFCSDGRIVNYGRLIWAAGGRPRQLTCEGRDLRGVHSVRTRCDIDQIIEALPRAARVAIIGGGYIGLEAAAVLRKLGKTVVVLEAADRVLGRVAGEPLSRFFESEHRAHGVEVRLGVSVTALVGSHGRLTGVQLSDGEVISAELAIVGIGIVPCVEPLVAVGAKGCNGLDVDEFCRTTLPDISAIGDCARIVTGSGMRIESVQNANDQAVTVAKDIVGAPVAFRATPWFWSNQYDLKLQTIGLSSGYDLTVTRGDPAERTFSVIYLRHGEVIALDCVNRPKDYVQGRALVESRSRIGAHLLACSTIELKSMMIMEEHNPVDLGGHK